MEGQPGNYLISDAGSTSVSRTALLEERIRSARIGQLPNDFHRFAAEPRAFVAGAAPVVGICRVDVYKSRRRCGVLLRRLCLVGSGASLRVPDLEAVQVKPRQAPVLAAQQAYWVIGRDSRAAAIAHVPEARTAPPQLNRARSWKQTAFDPISDELSHDIGNHHGSVNTSARPIERALGTGDSIRQSPLNTPLVGGDSVNVRTVRHGRLILVWGGRPPGGKTVHVRVKSVKQPGVWRTSGRGARTSESA